MNSTDRLQKIKNMSADILMLIRIERDHCNTHSQRNAAMALIRTLSEQVDEELRFLQFKDLKPESELLSDIPF